MFGIAAIAIGILTIVLISLLTMKFKKSRIEKMLLKVPGPEYNFLFGNAFQFMVAREDIYLNSQEILKPFREKGICRIWMGSNPRVALMKPRFVEAVLSNTRFLNKADDYVFLHPWLGTGLLTSTGSKWHSRRKLITPTFHFRILEDFLTVFNEQASILTTTLDDHRGKEAFDVYPYLARCTLDIICETAMGKSVNAQRETTSEYVTAVNDMSNIINYRLISPFLRPEFLFRLSSFGRLYRKSLRILHTFSKKVISERREMHQQKEKIKPEAESEIFGQKRRLAFLDMLLESSVDGKGLSDEDIREEVDTFMFEGHDTTSSALAWALYNIGRFPEVQEKVHEELDRVIGGTERPITSEELKDLKYLECVIKESLRLFPAVPFYGRQLTEDVDICGYTIPAGVTAMVSVTSVHQDPEYFPDPERFDPDRFLPENCVGRHPYAYVPFSAGPRNCIGQKFALMEEKLVMASVMRRFQVISMDKLEDIKIIAELILRPVNGLWMKFESRH